MSGMWLAVLLPKTQAEATAGITSEDLPSMLRAIVSAVQEGNVSETVGKHSTTKDTYIKWDQFPEKLVFQVDAVQRQYSIKTL